MKNSCSKGIALIVLMLVIGGNFISVEKVKSSSDLQSSDCSIETTNNDYCCGGFLLPETVIPNNLPSGTSEPPSTWDWRDAEYDGQKGNWMTSVKNQGYCGSCWAFAAIATLEGMVNVGMGLPDFDLDLSEQHLVSCCLYGCNGCKGGSPYYAWQYLKDNGGAILESSFPYEAVDANGCSDWRSDDCDEEPVLCSDKSDDWDEFQVPIATIGGQSTPDKSLIQSTIVNHGPVAAYMTIYADFRSYSGGIYEHKYGEFRGNHVVTLVGYNDEENYWIGKNSWGRFWGEYGYFKIAYGECNIEQQIYSVDVDLNAFNFPPSADTGGIYHGDVGETIYFNSDDSSDMDDDIISYEWDFGDGLTSTQLNPTHSYSEKGIYSLKLTVIDEHGEQDTDESAVFVDLWDVNDYWEYSINFQTNPDALYPPIYLPCEGSIKNLKLTVTEEDEDKYRLDFEGSVKGNMSMNFDIEDTIFDFRLWGKINYATIKGYIYLAKGGFGVEEINYRLRGFARLISIPCIPLPIWLPIPFDISVNTKMDVPRTILGISPAVGKSWDVPSSNSSFEITFSTLFGLLSKSFGNENVLEKNATFKCTESKDVTTGCGTFESFGISIQSSYKMLEYYYSPEVCNVVKIQGGDAELFNFSGELISTNMK